MSRPTFWGMYSIEGPRPSEPDTEPAELHYENGTSVVGDRGWGGSALPVPGTPKYWEPRGSGLGEVSRAPVKMESGHVHFPSLHLPGPTEHVHFPSLPMPGPTSSTFYLHLCPAHRSTSTPSAHANSSLPPSAKTLNPSPTPRLFEPSSATNHAPDSSGAHFFCLLLWTFLLWSYQFFTLTFDATLGVAPSQCTTNSWFYSIGAK